MNTTTTRASRSTAPPPPVLEIAPAAPPKVAEVSPDNNKDHTSKPPFVWRALTALFSFLFSLLSIVIVAAVVWLAHNNLYFPNDCKVRRLEGAILVIQCEGKIRWRWGS